MRIKVARIFNTYGPRMHPNDGRVVSNFIVQALRSKPITIDGEGTQTRSCDGIEVTRRYDELRTVHNHDDIPAMDGLDLSVTWQAVA